MWTIEVGQVLRRREVHDRQGGSRQNGITRAKGTNNLLLFSSPSGPQYGYACDGPKRDGTYHYTGEGQVGDQVFTAGNANIRDHVNRGLRLRLFEEVQKSRVRYRGEYRIDPENGYYYDDAPERNNGPLRKVIVFRLLPVDVEEGSGEQAEDPGEPLDRPVPLEKHLAEIFTRHGVDDVDVERREAELVQRYAAWLGAGYEAREIRLPHHARPLRVDLYDMLRKELVEAKASASRSHVRMAIGQLLDYGRYVSHRSAAALFPTDPSPDLVELLHSLGFTCVYEDQHGGFIRREPRSAESA